jgi:predicted dienelactone hydrolase
MRSNRMLILRWCNCAALALALGVAVCLAGCGESDDAAVVRATPTVAPTSTPIPLTSAQVLQPGPAAVGVTTITFDDTSRPTMANGSAPGLPSRTLITEIWYPAEPGATPAATETRDAPLAQNGRPYPLVIYSHGFASNRLAVGYLARQLASDGYVVASPDFPLTHAGTPGGPNFLDVVHQPGDVSFIIDQLLAMSADPHSAFSGAIDAQRIGLTGLSLGGMTTYLTTFDVLFRDPRVRAAAPQAGPACSFGSKFYTSAQVPLLIVHGDIDAIVPYQQNSVFAFGEAHPPKYLVTISAGSHTGFVDDGGLFESANNPDDIGCLALRPAGARAADSGETFFDMLGGSDAGIIMGDCPPGCAGPRHGPRAIRPSRQHQLTILSVVPFFEGYLRGNQQALDYLAHTLAGENADVAVQAEP